MATYTVETGDTLSAIARRYKTTVSELLLLNPKLTTDPRYKDGNVIFNGTKITLPSTKPKASTTTPPPVITAPSIPPSAPTTTTTPPVLTAPVIPVPQFETEPAPAPAAETQATPPPVAATADMPQASVPTVSSDNGIPTISLPANFGSVAVPESSPAVGYASGPAVETQYLKNPYTGQMVLDSSGQPIEIRPGGKWKDYLDYIVRGQQGKVAAMQAGAANKLAISQATATGETARRTAERDIYRSQQRALNELSRRGLSGAPGLTRAAQRAYGAAPLSQRLESIRKMQADITAANLLLAKQQQAQQAAEEASQIELTKATGIVNQLGGQ